MEKRCVPRMRAVLKAEARYDGGMMHVPCVIRDISDHGARLDLEGEVALPGRFDLFIEKRQRARRAVVRWRRGNEAGVAFDDAPDFTFDHDVVARISELESEIVELKAQLARKSGPAVPFGFPRLAAALNQDSPRKR